MNHLLSVAFYVLGYATGIAAFAWLAKRRNLATEGIFTLLAAGLIGGLAGANLVQFLATGNPGKTVLGGIACGYLCVVLTKRYLGIRRPTGDLFAVAISAGEVVGRWGCFFGGCCSGKAMATRLPWAVYEDCAWRHPAQIYDSVANAAILLILLRLLRRNPPENMLFFVQGTLYCIARFAIEFFREAPAAYAGLTVAQWGCVAGFTYFAVRLVLLNAQQPDSTLRNPPVTQHV